MGKIKRKFQLNHHLFWHKFYFLFSSITDRQCCDKEVSCGNRLNDALIRCRPTLDAQVCGRRWELKSMHQLTTERISGSSNKCDENPSIFGFVQVRTMLMTTAWSARKEKKRKTNQPKSINITQSSIKMTLAE